MKLRKRKDGLWTTQVKVSKGKYKSVYAKTKRECERKAKELLVEVETGKFMPDSSMTLSELWDRWLKVRAPLIKESSMIRYESIWRIHIKGEFGDSKIGEITTDDLQLFLNELSGQIKPRTVKMVRAILNVLFNYAVKADFLKSNPCAGVEIQRLKKKYEILEVEEFDNFVSAVSKRSEYPDVFELILYTGLRIGEALGLQVDQYDRDTGILTVDRQYNFTVRKMTDTKSGRSREFVLCGKAKEIIERNSAGKSKDEYVFGDGSKSLDYNRLYKQFKKASKDFGKPDLRIHDLRHSFATAAVSAGVDVKTLQDTLGHSTAEMTLEVYSHSSDNMKKAAAGKLDDLFGK